MKITNFKAKNFAGIYAGTGKDEIEVDFTNNENPIIMLLAGNGKGKTALLSILHPFRESYDNRRTLILEGKEGYKEIQFTNEEDNYIVKHAYGKTSSKNKSFIEKNGIELNDNGGINTFKEIMKEEFNLTEDYFTIGKIGSNVEGFIGLSTANRKTYINKFIPNIDEYIDGYAIVNEKYKTYNKNIKSLKDMISKIDIDNLRIEKTEVQTNIELYKGDIKTLEKSIILLENELNTIINSFGMDIIPTEEEVKDSLDIHNSNIENLNDYINKYPKLAELDDNNLKERLVSYKEIINNLTKDIEVDNSAIEDLTKSVIDKSNELEKINATLERQKQNFIPSKDLKTKIQGFKNDMRTYIKTIDELKTKLPSNIIDFIDNNKDAIYIMDNEVDKLSKTVEYIKDNNSLEMIDKYTEADLVIMNELLNSIYKRNKEISNSINDYDINLNQLSKEIFSIETNKEKYSHILDNIPNNCAEPKCPFIVDAVTFRTNSLNKLEVYIDRENNLTNDKSILEEEYNENILNGTYLSQLKDFTIEFKDYLYLPKIMKPLYILECLKEPEIIEIFNNYNRLAKDYITANNEIGRLEKNISDNEVLLTISYEKEETIKLFTNNINEINDIIEKKTIQKSDIEERLKKNKIDLIRYNKSITVFNSVLDCRNKANVSLATYNNIKRLYDTNFEKIQKKKDIEDKLVIDNNLLYNRETEIGTFEERYKTIENEMYVHSVYIKDLNDLQDNMTNIELVKDALDPKKGIPLIFMNNYLNIISKKANDLLDKAYDGAFKISFEVTSKEFLISVHKSDGTMLKDISEASQGEMSLTTIALSLAMMENLLKDCKYNILYLDEVDATLSTQNRRIFLDLLEVQLVNIEQCFIISHNDEFYSYPIDMILFEGNTINKQDEELMENKNILFDINR